MPAHHQPGDVAAAKAARAQAEADLKAADEELKAVVLSRVGTLTRAANLLRAVSGFMVAGSMYRDILLTI